MPTTLAPSIQQFIAQDVLQRFLRYVQIYTTSDASSESNPSSDRQLDLIRILESELKLLALKDIHVDAQGFLYATLPSNQTFPSEPFGILAHVDTSPDQPGEHVRPQLHTNWNGFPIGYPDDPALTLSTTDSPELKHFIGDTIITAAGTTLLGADDKAGVAEIVSALATFKQYPHLPHGEIRICFTHDEEIGRGVKGLDLGRLPRYCYTMDGGFPGELEDECFDARRAVITIKGLGVHPGYAKNKMINAGRIAAFFATMLPEAHSPEYTEDRDGFFHLNHISGDHENALLQYILRDFDANKNDQRVALLEQTVRVMELRYPGVSIKLEAAVQYRNMHEILKKHPHVVELAAQAIECSGLSVIRKAIRGGTDGSLLCALGHPTPNIFAGGMLFHSRKEWVAHSALTKATETIVHLARLWSDARL